MGSEMCIRDRSITNDSKLYETSEKVKVNLTIPCTGRCSPLTVRIYDNGAGSKCTGGDILAKRLLLTAVTDAPLSTNINAGCPV